MKRNKTFFSFIIIFSFFACSFDYGILQEDPSAQEIPNTVLNGFSHIIINLGKPVLELRSDKAESFEGKKQTFLTKVTFFEYDINTGKTITSGTSDSAIIFTESNNVELSGNISLDSKRDGVLISASYLFWNNDKKTLTSRQDQTLQLAKEDGTTIRGEGFSANAKTKTFKFTGPSEGSYVSSEDSGSK